MRRRTSPPPPVAPQAPAAKLRRVYEKPLLVRRGDVRSNVFGPSAGPGDSPIGRVPV